MLRVYPLLRHVARFGLGAALVVLSIADAPWLVLVTGPYFFLGTFAFQHDLLHGALGLPRWLRDGLLAFVGQTIGMSGHATQTMHLLHHRRFHAREDLEGLTVDLPLIDALMATPSTALRMRPAGYRHASGRVRRWQVFEHAVNVIVALSLVAMGGLGGALFVLVLVAFQITMPLWAGRIPHRVPAWARRLAAAIARFGSVTAMSLAFHKPHHARPDIPTHLLRTRS